MKKIIIAVAVLAVVVAFSVKPAFAAKDNAASQPGLKIAVVDLNRALNEVPEGKKAKSNLEKEFKAKKAELEKSKKELENMRAELEKKSHLLSQEALTTKRDAFQRKFMGYQQKAKEYTEQLAQKEAKETGRILNKLKAVVDKVAAKEGYTFVFEKSQGAVIYGPSSADITTQVIKRYK